jgi:hypothetical protein
VLDRRRDPAVVLGAGGGALDHAEIGLKGAQPLEEVVEREPGSGAVVEEDVVAVGIEHRRRMREPVRVVHGARGDDAGAALAARIAREVRRIDQRDLETVGGVG